MRGQPTARIVVVIAVCLIGLALVVAADRMVGPPSNRPLADAVAIGG